MGKEFTISDNDNKVKEESKNKDSLTEKVNKTTSKEKPKQETPSVKNTKENTPKTENTNKSKKKISFKQLILPIVAILTLTGIGLFYYFGIYKVKPTPPSEIVSFNTNFISSIESLKTFVTELTLLSKPEEPRTEESPLNGLLFTKSEMDEMMKRRPVAVMVNNHALARPQSGLSKADIVIEANVESGITRYLAIFWSNGPEKVGPIRSIRQYHLEWLSEYDPIVIHDGCAESDDPRVNACGNIYTYGLKDIATIGAWRWNDGKRYAPHNEYSSVEYAWEYAEKMGWDDFPSTIDSWEFKKDADISDRGEKTKVNAIFHQRLSNSGYYDTTWTYDSTTNSYFRKVGGQSDMDQNTNTPISAKNVIIQEVDLTPTYDLKAHIIIDTIDSGDAVFLIDGKIINGSWEKKSRTDRTTYYDSSGKEIIFNRGLTWIAMIPHNEGKFAIIEQ